MNIKSKTTIKTKVRIETKIRTLLALQAKTRERLDGAAKAETDDVLDEIPLDEVTPQSSLGGETADDDFDCEMGFKDDDAVFNEGAAVEFGQEDSWLDEEVSESAFAPNDCYEIRVVKDRFGNVECVVQDDEWASADGIPNNDELIVEQRQKMKWLKKIASWLETNCGVQLSKGPENFIEQCPMAAQKEVYTDGKYKSAFGRYIRCIRLVWEQGSIPVWHAFKE